jgi:hypothetical protein
MLSFHRIICVLKRITISVACLLRGQHKLSNTNRKLKRCYPFMENAGLTGTVVGLPF